MAEWSVRRINYLLGLTEGKRYLEIGVEYGWTFKQVVANLKVAVDPVFQFDTSKEEKDSEHYIQHKSDFAFARLNSLNYTFDVIFLDGLHQYEQTYRDFINACELLEPGGFILIDDVYPVDEHSFMRSREAASSSRMSSLGPERYFENWQGDVFKAIAMIHDFHPQINYKTFSAIDQQQTLLWFDALTERTPRFSDLQELCSLDYSGFLNNRDILNLDTEGNILDFIENSVDRI